METSLFLDFVNYLTMQKRITLPTTAMNKLGSQTHTNSLFITANPQLLKNALMPMGETSMGVHGKKYLV